MISNSLKFLGICEYLVQNLICI